MAIAYIPFEKIINILMNYFVNTIISRDARCDFLPVCKNPKEIYDAIKKLQMFEEYKKLLQKQQLFINDYISEFEKNGQKDF